jgi:hypothetical protein
MLDFPNSPTANQIFTAPNGATWTWDGVKWASTGAGTGFLPLSGGTLNGDLSINNPSTTLANLALNGPATGWSGIQFNISGSGNNVEGAWIGSYVGGKERWEIDLGEGIAETGSNAGSNFQIARYADNGTIIDHPLTINRATGQVLINGVAANSLYRNRIINGDMSVDQRNGGAVVQNIPAGYVIDRWKYNGLASIGQAGQSANTPTPAAIFTNLLVWNTMTAHTVVAGDSFSFLQIIEGDQFNDAMWGTVNAQPVMLEFYATASVTGTYSGVLRNAAANRSYAFTYVVPSANAFQKYRISIPGDTTGTWSVAANAAALSLIFDLGTGATYSCPAGSWQAGNFTAATGAKAAIATLNLSLYITGVALMVGAAAANAEPEFRKVSDNLIDCQRYYQSDQVYFHCYSGAPDIFGYMYPIRPMMRAAPTITFISPAYTNSSGLTATQTTIGSFVAYATVTATGNANFNSVFKADADF